MSNELSNALVELNREAVLRLVNGRLEQGDPPLAVLEACRQGMKSVGDQFEAGEFYLAELVLSADIFKAAAAVIDPHLKRTSPPEPLGKVVLATMRGDIHDLGKQLVATLLRAHGFEVHDLGVNVAPARVVECVSEVAPGLVGFSALITTAFDSMKEAAELLEAAGLRKRLKLLVGGGVTTPAVGDYVGADFQTRDAIEGVAYCLKLAAGGRHGH